MVVLDKEKRYIVWGTGISAARFMYNSMNRIMIDFCVDNYVGGTFCGRKVFKFRETDKEIINGHFIIVATSERTYMEIKKQLNEFGYREFLDYAYYKHLEKKIAMLHGNCHMNVIKSYLTSSQQFENKYCVYPNQLIQDIKEKCIDEEVLKGLDIFIHQDIRSDNCFGYELSDTYVLSKLKGDCLQITVPNLFGMGNALFPQMVWNKNNPTLAGNMEGFFPHGDIILDKAVAENKSIYEILQQIRGDVFSREEILDNFRINMDKIRERELNWDIKIYNFIIENYRKVKLFYNAGHPTNVVMKEIALGILKLLQIEDDEISCDYEMDSYEEPVYECVARTLELEWKDSEIRKGSKDIMKSKMTIDEYVREYLFWCYQIQVNRQ